MRQKCSAAGFIFSYILFFPSYNSCYRTKGTESRGYNFKNFRRYQGTEPITKLKYDLHMLQDVCALHATPLAIGKLYKIWISPLRTIHITVILYHHFVNILTEVHVIVHCDTRRKAVGSIPDGVIKIFH